MIIIGPTKAARAVLRVVVRTGLLAKIVAGGFRDNRVEYVFVDILHKLGPLRLLVIVVSSNLVDEDLLREILGRETVRRFNFLHQQGKTSIWFSREKETFSRVGGGYGAVGGARIISKGHFLLRVMVVVIVGRRVMFVIAAMVGHHLAPVTHSASPAGHGSIASIDHHVSAVSAEFWVVMRIGLSEDGSRDHAVLAGDPLQQGVIAFILSEIVLKRICVR
jgi:hypothetical protein